LRRGLLPGAATLTAKRAVLTALPAVERVAIYTSVSKALRQEITLSMMAADLLRSLLEYKGDVLELVRNGDDVKTLEDYGGGFRAENRCEERALGAALRQLRQRSLRLRASLAISLALSRKPTIPLDNVRDSVLRGLPPEFLRNAARTARREGPTHLDRLEIAAKGAAEKRSAGDAASAATATAKAATATTLATALAATAKWTAWPLEGATVAALKIQLAHHGAVAKHGERLKINCDAAGASVTGTASTSLGSIESKAQVASLVKLILADGLVVAREGSTLMLRRRAIAPAAASPEPVPEPPPPVLGPTPARPPDATAAEHAPLPTLPPDVPPTSRRRRPPQFDKQRNDEPAKRRVTTSVGGAESPAVARLVRVSAATAPKRKAPVDDSPANSSRPPRQRRAPPVMDV
jgi:hypothetical protein